MNHSGIDSDLAYRLYHSMLRIRMVEEEVANRYSVQDMRCPVHLSIGQEGIATGVCEALRPEDMVFSNHRAHGHYLAKGGDLGQMIAEFYGKADGCCGGRGGSMHLIDKSVNFMGSTPIVGGTVPLAVGAGWSNRLQERDAIAVAFFGDGCFEEGVVHESMNFAKLYDLPVVFVCENNEFSVYTHLHERQPARPIHAIAAAHGWHTETGDGSDVVAVYEATRKAVEAARAGEGPQFLEFSVYRWREHCGPNFDDHLNYRSADEVATGLASCPVTHLAEIMFRDGSLDANKQAATRADINREVQAAFEFAYASPEPSVDDTFVRLYAD